MTAFSWGKGLGLVLTGFLGGVIFSQFGKTGDYIKQNLGGSEIRYAVVARTLSWDVLKNENNDAEILLGQNGIVRVSVLSEDQAMHVTTYDGKNPMWQGRLLDVGNDGSIEVADITGSSCEDFTAGK